MWVTGGIAELFHEAEALQNRSIKPKSSRRKDELREFDAHKSAGPECIEMYQLLRKSGVLSLTEKNIPLPVGATTVIK